MTSAAKIEANKRNAKRSTGPRTPGGKEKSRLNAVKHGLTANTVVLPHEDAEAYARRVQSWTAELGPRGDLGRYLAERAARLSWQLDRADTYERDRLARQLREAECTLVDGGAGATEALLQKLYATADEPPHAGPWKSGRSASRSDSREPDPADEPPSAILRRLTASAGGCHRLLEEWQGLLAKAAAANDAAPGWRWIDLNSVFRLLGLRLQEARIMGALDRRIGLLVKVHQEVAHRDVLELLRAGIGDDLDPEDEDEPADQPEPETEPVPEPPLSFDVAEANREFRAIAAEQVARLTARLAGHEADGRADRADLPSRCSFDATAEGERVHRYQMHWGRALLQTLAAVAKLPDAPGVAEAAPPSPPAESPRPAPAQAAPPEAVEAPEAPEAPRRNEPTAEEATPVQERACVEMPGENEATSAAVAAADAPPRSARREETGGRHAQRDLRKGAAQGRPGPGDAGGGETVAIRRRRE